MSLDKLTDNYVPERQLLSSDVADKNSQIRLMNEIASQSSPVGPPLRRIEDISPIDFKRDLLETTDWHMYYKKLNSLRYFHFLFNFE